MSLFGYVDIGGTSPDDLRSLLSVHAAMAARGGFTYLEVGAYLGRSLQALVADPRCRNIIVIDRRDEASPDERGAPSIYAGNTTANMLEHLSSVPGANIAKVTSLDAATDAIEPTSIRVDLCFIDAEHTNPAALRDARFCRTGIRDRGVIVFHDRTLVDRGIRRFLRELRNYRAYPLAHDLLVVEIGVPTLLSDPRVRASLPRRGWLAIDRLHAIRPALWLFAQMRRRGTSA